MALPTVSNPRLASSETLLVGFEALHLSIAMVIVPPYGAAATDKVTGIQL